VRRSCTFLKQMPASRRCSPVEHRARPSRQVWWRSHCASRPADPVRRGV